MLQHDARIVGQMPPSLHWRAESLNVLVYQSVAVSPPSESELDNLLRVSQARNQALGLTGVLLYDRGKYYQWLEGAQEAVNRVWRSIERDPRHHHITILRDEPISDRLFDVWHARFSQGSQATIEAVIAAMEQSNERFIAIVGKRESLLALSLSDVFASHVLPRLAGLHAGARSNGVRSSTASIWHAGLGTGEALARYLLEDQWTPATRYVDSLLDAGAGFNALYQEVFEPAQLQLGKLWDAEICDDFRLAISLARLQVELRRVNAAVRSDHRYAPGHSVLLSSQPNESHRMGVAMSSEVFDRGGWDVTCEYPTTDQALGDIVHERWFDVLKLSQSGAVRRDGQLGSLRATIDLARAKSLNRSLIVMVDGRTFVERPHMFRAVHANAMSANALESVAVAARLLQASRTAAATCQVASA